MTGAVRAGFSISCWHVPGARSSAMRVANSAMIIYEAFDGGSGIYGNFMNYSQDSS